MSTALAIRSWRLPVLVVGLMFSLALAIFGVALIGNVRLLAVVVGFGALVFLAWLSGNPRLFCLWLLLQAIPLNLSRYFTPIINHGSGEMAVRVEIFDPFLLVLLLYQVRDLFTGRLQAVRIPKVIWYWLAVMLMGCLTVAFGRWRWDATLELIRMTKLTVLFLVMVNELRRPRQILHCATALSLGVIFEAIIGLAEYFRQATLGLDILGETSTQTIEILSTNSVQGEKVWRVSALLMHPNIFGVFLAVLLPLAVAAFLLRLGPFYKTFFLATCGLGMAALIATQSRSAWVSFAAAFCVVMGAAVLRRGMRQRSLMAVGAAALAITIVCAAFAGPIARRLLDSKDDATLGREVFKQDAKRMIAAQPIFGFGLNSYVDALPPYMKFSRKAFGGGWLPPVHQIYYLWWAETGIVGLSLHLAILATLLGVGIANFRVQDEMLYALNAACLGGIVALMTDGFFSFSMRISPIMRVWWVIAAMIMAVRYIRLHQSAARVRFQAVPAAPMMETAPIA